MNYVTWPDLFVFLTFTVTAVGVFYNIWTKKK